VSGDGQAAGRQTDEYRRERRENGFAKMHAAAALPAYTLISLPRRPLHVVASGAVRSAR